MGEIIGFPDLSFLDVPNCPKCLQPMVPTGETGREVWACADCATQIAP